MERQEEIQVIAYLLWQNEGCPEGRHLDHWLKAEAMWREQGNQEHSVKRTESRVKRTGRRTATRPAARSAKQKSQALTTKED